MDRIEGIVQLKNIKKYYERWLYKLDPLDDSSRRTDEDILIQLREIIRACFPNYTDQGIKLNWEVEIIYIDNYCPYTGKCNKIFQKISISSKLIFADSTSFDAYDLNMKPTSYYEYDLKSGILFFDQSRLHCEYDMLIYPFRWDAIEIENV